MPRAAMGAGNADRTRQFSKTKLCKFELLGMCAKGLACPFAHGEGELKDLPDLRCTKLCVSVLQTGTCNKLDCTFAHSREELRMTGTLRKTKLCRFAKTGNCVLGPKCGFAHSPTEIRQQDMVSASYPAFPPGLDLQEAREQATKPDRSWAEYVEEEVETPGSEGASLFPFVFPADPTEGAGFAAYGAPGPADYGDYAWAAGAYDEALWAGAGAAAFGAPGQPAVDAFGAAYGEPAYVPLPGSASAGSWEEMPLQGSVLIDQAEGMWQSVWEAKPAEEGEQPAPQLRSVRTSESTLCTLGDELPAPA